MCLYLAIKSTSAIFKGIYKLLWGFPWWLIGKESACNARD